MGRVREQAQGEVLPAHGRGKTQTANRSTEVASNDGRDRGHSWGEAGGSMRTWARFRSWAGATLRRSRMESEMDAELRFHMEAYVEDLMCGGVARQEALRRARLEFGGIERFKEEGREARGVNLIETVVQDARFAMRRSTSARPRQKPAGSCFRGSDNEHAADPVCLLRCGVHGRRTAVGEPLRCT